MRLAELAGFRRRRRAGECPCLTCGRDTLSARRPRCPPCQLERFRARERKREAGRGVGSRSVRRQEHAARLLHARLEGDDVDLF